MSTTVIKGVPLSGELAGDYWEQARSPLASLVFVGPMLAGYELGAIWLGSQGLKSGAALWLQDGLAQLGLAGAWLTPALTVAVLLGWQHASGRPWRLSAFVPLAMTLEAAAMAAAMVLAAQAQMMLVSSGGVMPVAGLWQELTAGHALAQVVLYLGAGLYEEFLFRLALLPALAWIFACVAGLGRPSAWFAAALVSSVCFAGAHYIGPHGDVFAWPSFAVRLLAGGFFAALFVLRGFGIAAGAHAFYDIWVGCVA